MYHPDSLEVGDQNVNSLGEFVFHTPVKGRVPHATKPTAKAVALPSSAIEKFFSCPPPPSELQTLKPKQSSLVLTSSENRQLLQEKEQKKEAAKQKREATKQRGKQRNRRGK